jgi:DNA (cytosine-5)-methyltransferase 1
VSCAEYHEPAVCVIENVAEFKTWKLFGAWRWAMEALGYVLTEQVIDSADCGVAQHRPRLILVASRHGAIEIPKPDRPHRSARDILDLEGGKWSPVDKPGRSPATLARVARGRIDVGDEFVMPYYSSGSGLTGRSLDRPIGAITCKDRWALVRGDRMRMLSVDEYRKAMGFGAEYQLPRVAKKRAVRLLGNAICPPVAEHCVRAVLNHFS